MQWWRVILRQGFSTLPTWRTTVPLVDEPPRVLCKYEELIDIALQQEAVQMTGILRVAKADLISGTPMMRDVRNPSAAGSSVWTHMVDDPFGLGVDGEKPRSGLKARHFHDFWIHATSV